MRLGVDELAHVCSASGSAYLTFGQAQDRWPVPAELRHGDAWSRDVAPEEQTRRVQEAKQALKRVKGEQIGHDCVRKWGKACVGHQG